MRLVTITLDNLNKDTQDLINDIQYFGNEMTDCGRTFKSNTPEEEDKLREILSEVLYPRYPYTSIISTQLHMKSNVVAIYDIISERYYVLKNRFMRRTGWHTTPDFKVLIDLAL